MVYVAEFDKAYLRTLGANGFKYSGFWGGMYHFSKKIETGKYETAKFYSCDIKSKDCCWAMNNNLSR